MAKKGELSIKNPSRGLLNSPYVETRMRGFEPLPVVGFLLDEIQAHKIGRGGIYITPKSGQSNHVK